METTIFSDGLFLEIIGILGSEVWPGDQQRTVNGLVLLKYYHMLKRHLKALNSKPPAEAMTGSMALEVELLVDGLLADGEVFKSFGYEDLYERGFLDFELWKKFQQDKLERDISALEEGFYAIDDDLEEFLIPPANQNPVNPRSTQTESFIDVAEYVIDTAEHVTDTADEIRDLQESLAHANGIHLCSTKVEVTINEVDSFKDLPISAELLPTSCESNSSLQLAKAAEAGHEAVIRLLLDQGASVNGKYFDSPLAEAAKAGHEEEVRLLLDRGAVPRFDEFDPYWLSKWAESAKPGYISDSLLVAAATCGNKSAVLDLLNMGTDVNVVTQYGSPLSAAVRAGHNHIGRLLLRQGADVQTARVIIQGSSNACLEVKRLLKIAFQVKNDITSRPHHYNLEKVLKLRYLHKKFSDQHVLMLKATHSSSTEFRGLNQRFRYYQQAWAAGIRTMRGLCSGESPGNVGDTIAFLCVAKAISETLSIDGCDYNEQFLQDLARWQVLFTSKKSDLDAYRDAVQSMWDVAVDEILSTQQQSGIREALLHLQKLASTLVSQAGESLGPSALNYSGLEGSQRRWRLRNGQVPLSTDISDSASHQYFPGASGPQLMEAIPPRPPDQAICSNTSSLRE